MAAARRRGGGDEVRHNFCRKISPELKSLSDFCVRRVALARHRAALLTRNCDRLASMADSDSDEDVPLSVISKKPAEPPAAERGYGGALETKSETTSNEIIVGDRLDAKNAGGCTLFNTAQGHYRSRCVEIALLEPGN